MNRGRRPFPKKCAYVKLVFGHLLVCDLPLHAEEDNHYDDEQDLLWKAGS